MNIFLLKDDKIRLLLMKYILGNQSCIWQSGTPG